ncbi:MAG: marine proteobacterial sortase target protein [Thermoanaerobaculia bacterium]
MRPAAPRLILCLLLAFTLPTIASSQSVDDDLGEPISLHQVQGGSLLYRTAQPGVFLPAPSLETDVVIRVTGLIARTQVRQRFHNPTDDWLEGVYAFPLPSTAAVDRLVMVIGDRTVEGEIRERGEAKKVYEEAKRQGKKASLVEQERPNLFTTSVANIGPHEDIDIVIEYQQDLALDQGRFSLRFPMVVAPRYVPGSCGEDGGYTPANGLPAMFSGYGWALATDQVVAAGGQNPVYLQVDLDAGLPLARIESPSHALDVEKKGTGKGNGYLIELQDLVVPADRDFVLEWEPEPGSAPRAALFSEQHGGDSYLLLMVVPPHGDEAGQARVARETIFVIDTSGSMDGASIRQARQALLIALDRLRPGDHFNVIRFANAAEQLFPDSVPADELHLERAARYVESLSSGGGTEMLSALRLALGGQDVDRGVRQVIFVTDGSVGNEDALFAYIHQHLGQSRLFTVGIGSAPNSHFMRNAARFGRGTFTYIGQVGEVAERMGELFAKLESPVLHGIEILWDDVTAETWPAPVPDLYLGEPVMVVAKLSAAAGEVTVSGWRGTVPWETRFDAGAGARESGIHKLWARKKIAALMDGTATGVDAGEIRRQVIELALEHHLVSKYTSLVAVDRFPTAPAGETPKTRPLPVNLPAGWSGGHVSGQLPSGATPARLHLLVGLLALGTAAWLARRRRLAPLCGSRR